MKAKSTTTNTKTVETTQNIPTNNSNTLKDKDKKGSVSPKDSNKDTKKVEDNRSPLEKKSFRLLKNNGMLDGYKFVLANICKDGLPQGDVFEYAAYLFASYEKKWKQLKSKEVKEKIMKFKEEKQKSKMSDGGSLNNSFNARSLSPKLKESSKKQSSGKEVKDLNNINTINSSTAKNLGNSSPKNALKSDTKVDSKVTTEKKDEKLDKDVKQKVDDKKDIKDTNKDVKKDTVAKPVVVSKKK